MPGATTILDQIIEARLRRLREAQKLLPFQDLVKRLSTANPVPPFAPALQKDGINVIAEIKYQSPSRGRFQCRMPAEAIARSYVSHGAAALSILTEEDYFDGRLDYVSRIRHELDSMEPRGNRVPVLRKDFIVDRYQVAESRLHGASAILLIVAGLKPLVLGDLVAYAEELELKAVVEIHDRYELEAAINANARIIGVNNRNLKDFHVDVAVSFDIARELERETGYTLVAESGISSASLIRELREAGFSAFLIGSSLMDSEDPGRRLAALLEAV